MPDKFSDDQLVHYFAGECSEKEAAEIEAWINADPKRKRRVERLRKIWEAAEWRPKDRPDVDAMWANLAHRLGPSELNEEQKADEATRARSHRRSRDPSARSRSSRYLSRLSTVVASVAIIVFGIWAFYQDDLIDPASSMRKITTDVGQRAQVHLGDGTQMMLNAESEVRLPPEFSNDARKVTLRGQAYFEVTPDSERPFLVHTEGSVVRVHGTKFDVGAYPEDETVRVVVAEGKVSVRSTSEDSGGSVELTERQMASLSKSDASVVRREVDPSPYLAWTEGKLVFKDAPFDEIVRRLRTRYGLRVKLDGSVDRVDRLNAMFTDEPVDEVLTILAETLDLRYEREGKTITFHARE